MQDRDKHCRTEFDLPYLPDIPVGGSKEMQWKRRVLSPGNCPRANQLLLDNTLRFQVSFSMSCNLKALQES
jgi:hypothetical protein